MTIIEKHLTIVGAKLISSLACSFSLSIDNYYGKGRAEHQKQAQFYESAF